MQCNERKPTVYTASTGSITPKERIQRNRLSLAGYEKYESEITHTEPAGEGARDRILEYEKARAKVLEDELDNRRHKRP